jgi:hypothetical protein
MISISILRAAGLTDEQIVRVIETEQTERMLTRREQNRQSARRYHEKKTQRNQRSSQQNGDLRADIAETKTDVALPKADRFDELWAAYPKRGGASNPKKPARDKFERAVKAGADPDAIIAAARRYHEIERQAGRAGTDKIAQLVTWLNQQRWNDYPMLFSDVPVTLTHGTKLQDGVYVKADTPEWEAWCRHLRRQGKATPPTDKAGGWRFPTLEPPTLAPVV